MALQSGGIRFYDADHVIEYNHIDGTDGSNFQDPLILDTGDAEGSSSNLSGHWRVIGAQVRRNVLVDVPRGITIGDNYSSVPRDCTIADNLVVDADSGSAITQRVAPSNTVQTGNQYFSSTSAAGMDVGADTIARKPGYGPRLTFLTDSDVGPGAVDTPDGDEGTGAELGGAVAVPADVLDIGTGEGQRHFALRYVENGGDEATEVSLSELAAGFNADPYFTVVTNEIDDVDVPAVQLQVRADVAEISGAELREVRDDGADRLFEAMVGEHTLSVRARITHLPSADPEVVVAALDDGVNGHRVAVGTRLSSGQTDLVVWINGSEAAPTLNDAYQVDNEFQVEIRIREGGGVEVFYGGSSYPVVTGQLAASGAGASWQWKAGALPLFDEDSAGSSTEYATVELRDLLVSHSGARVDVGEDATAVIGQEFTRRATELGLVGVTARRWTVVSRPTAPEDPGTGDPGPTDPGDPVDLTQAAIRHGWGTPHPLSDEFNYTGTPNSTKWKLPGSDWKGHNGNGRRRPERSTVADGKLIMTGLQNGDSGWMQHKLDQRYGRWEARVRSFAGAPSAGENDNTSNGNDYHPLLLLWPTSNERQPDGEYDFMENGAPGESTLEAYMHFPHPGTSVVQQRHFERPNSNLSQFHNIALEWTSQHLKGFFDGVEWFSTSGGANDVRRNIQDMPSGHLCIQLDNFDGTNQTPATIEVEWVRIYTL